MKQFRLTSRLIEHFLGLVAMAMLSAGLLVYAYQEPDRISMAQASQQAADLDEAMSLYAENCAVCHGLDGGGIGTVPALDNLDLQAADPAALDKIISRGLYGTAMPAWNISDGGPLSDYQVAALVTLIQYGDWKAAQDRVVNLGLAPLVPFTAVADPALLAQVSKLPEGELLAKGVETYARQCVACHGADGLGSALAPALNDPALREKDPSEIERTLLNGVNETLMASWSNILAVDELAALLELLSRWDEVPAGAVPEPERPVPVTTESLALGSDLYALSCSRCHGPEGQGTARAPALNVSGFLADTSDLAIQQIITMGAPGTAMPAWGDRLTEVQIQAITGFIRAWEPTAPEVAEPARAGGGPWWATSGAAPGNAGRGGRQGSTLPTPTPANKARASSPLAASPVDGAVPTPTAVVVASTGADSQNGLAAANENRPGVAASTHTGGGGPPWAQTEPELTCWQELDWRVVALSGGVIGLSLVLVLPAAWVLRKLPAVSRG